MVNKKLLFSLHYIRHNREHTQRKMKNTTKKSTTYLLISAKKKRRKFIQPLAPAQLNISIKRYKVRQFLCVKKMNKVAVYLYS